uniref:IS1182 family transposase n=1 Tax=Roseihalotalea indica TaxID=2867963 RepID=A0AA49GR94_9BACT|nr:IS1182 family transposase [Tunicatimonas sp. TK19036]
MKFIQGTPRTQAVLFATCLDDAIEADNEVRLLDVFVDSLKLEEFGFRLNQVENGRPAYHPATLLKLFIYGYLNRIRSSRQLEKECKRNIEVIWLMSSLQPDHNTIANFRKDNPKAIKKVFRATVQVAKHFELIGGSLLAGDSTRLRAQNSKKNNYNEKKIQRHQAYIEQKLEEYSQALADADAGQQAAQIQGKIAQQLERKSGYEQLQKALNASGQEQISVSDPESRLLMIRNNISEVVYTVQTTVDAQHCLPIDYQVTNQNDSKAMGGMVRRAKSIVRNQDLTVLFDKGYHTGSELAIAQGLGINTMVAIPAPAAGAPDAAYNVDQFVYDTAKDHYRCPQGELLTSQGTMYAKNYKGGKQIFYQQYKTKACMSCAVKSSCTASKRGRTIERNEHAQCCEQNKKNIEADPTLYKRRQAIVEHPFGTIKRQWGFDHVLTKKGMQRASADVGLIFVVYNLRRIINILGFNVLLAYFKACVTKIALYGLLCLLARLVNSICRPISFHFTRPANFLSPLLLLSINIIQWMVFRQTVVACN